VSGHAHTRARAAAARRTRAQLPLGTREIAAAVGAKSDARLRTGARTVSRASRPINVVGSPSSPSAPRA
jgi:hypothetical protein